MGWGRRRRGKHLRGEEGGGGMYGEQYLSAMQEGEAAEWYSREEVGL